MAVLEEKALEYIKEQMNRIIKKIEEGKYELDFAELKCGTKDDKQVKDKEGRLWSTSKRNFHDSFIIEYIDKEAETQYDKKNI